MAICEQLEDPSAAKGLVKRGIIRVVTPGTVIEGSMLDESRNNYLAALYARPDSGDCGVCFCDCSTGELQATTLSGDDVDLRVSNELSRFNPSEIVVNPAMAENAPVQAFIEKRLHCRLEKLPQPQGGEAALEQAVLTHYGVESAAAIGMPEMPLAAAAVGLVLQYLHLPRSTGWSAWPRRPSTPTPST